jgi:hypothetical protein
MELSIASELGQPDASRPKAPYTLLLSRGSFLHPPALEKLLAAATAANLDILGCAADIILPTSKTNTHLFEPLGGCIEAGVFANVFGCGCVLVRSDLLPQKPSELWQCLDQTMIWPFLAEHVAAGRQCDALPERLFTLRASEHTFAQGDKNYQAHFEVLQACSHNLPDWVNRVLVASVASDQNVARLYGRIAQLEGERQVVNQYNVGTVLFKVNRERRRIKNQIKGLARRLGVGARGASSNSG